MGGSLPRADNPFLSAATIVKYTMGLNDKEESRSDSDTAEGDVVVMIDQGGFLPATSSAPRNDIALATFRQFSLRKAHAQGQAHFDHSINVGLDG